MRILALLLFILIDPLFAQDNSILWVVNPRIGIDSRDSSLIKDLDSLRNLYDINSIFVNGAITSDGSEQNLIKAKEIFSRFNNYNILPGKSESSESALFGINFNNVFENSNFSTKIDSTFILGFGNSSPFSEPKGYFNIETINWLDEELENILPTQNIIIFINHSFTNTINSQAVLNKFHGKKLVAIVSSEFTKQSYWGKGKIATPSGYLSAKDDKDLRIKLIRITNDDFSIAEINYSKDRKKYKTYKFTEVPIKAEPNEKLFLSKQSKIIWENDFKYSMIAPPLIYDNNIIAADKSGLITCFDINGIKKWDFDAFGNIISDPTAANGYLAVGTTQGDLLTIDLKSGESNQSIGFDEAIVTPIISFEYKGNKKLMVPRIGKSRSSIIIGTVSGKLFCLDMLTFEEIWHSNIIGSAVFNKPMKIKNNLYFTSLNGHLFCLDSRDGTLIWKIKINKKSNAISSYSNIITDNKNLYFTKTGGNIYSINAKLGTINWVKNYKAWKSLGISSDKKNILVISKDGRLNIINPTNGKARKIVTTNFGGEYFNTEPLFDNKIFLAASSEGKVIRISKKYSYKTILKLPPAPLQSIQKIREHSYLLSNVDGRIISFSFN